VIEEKRRLRLTSVELEVPFHEVDPMGIVWHGHYLRYFDVARTRLLRKCGLDEGRPADESRFYYMVSESQCRHAFPLRYGERFRVDAWLHDVERRLKIQFEIHNLDQGRRSARGHTILVCVDAQGKMLLKTPQSVLDRVLE
jgi:acyl-CoA thioester hydrolase